MTIDDLLADELADAARWIDRRIADEMAAIEAVGAPRAIVEQRRARLARLRAFGLTRLEAQMRAAAGRLN